MSVKDVEIAFWWENTGILSKNYDDTQQNSGVGATKEENLFMCDSKGVITHKRDDVDPKSSKGKFIRKSGMKTLADAFKGADVFVGCSVGGVVTKDMVASMAENPIVSHVMSLPSFFFCDVMFSVFFSMFSVFCDDVN